MKKKVLLLILLVTAFGKVFAAVFNINEPRLLLGSTNDKRTYGLAYNDDDYMTASAEIKLILPRLSFSLKDNSYTNRGYRTNPADAASFMQGRYDELSLTAATDISLFAGNVLSFSIKPEAGILFLGRFGMDFAQNFNHYISNVPEVSLPYDHFTIWCSPVLNATLRLEAILFPKAGFILEYESRNALFYRSEQSADIAFQAGKDKALFAVSGGYEWNKSFTDVVTTEVASKACSGFTFGLILDTGILRTEYKAWETLNGSETLLVDALALSRHDWKHTDIIVSEGVSFFDNVFYLESQIEYDAFKNTDTLHTLSLVLNNRYLSGFKKNDAHPDETARMQRNYVINSAGVKFRFPSLADGWLVPYIEAAAGVSTYDIRKLTNHLNSDVPVEDFGIKNFFELESTFGVTIIPEGFINAGDSTISISLFAGPVIIPAYKKAGEYISQDRYRQDDWQLPLFNFRYGFFLKFGLDF